jgi:hypothetical protein
MTDPAHPQNAAHWYNLTSWTVNVTRYAPSLEDLVWAGPRMVKKLSSFIAVTDSESLHQQGSTLQNIAQSAGQVIDNGLLRPGPSNLHNIMDPATDTFGGLAGGAADEAAARMSSTRMTMESARGFGSVFSYATSKWAITTIVMAVILNRTHIYAATRRRLTLKPHVRLFLRILPIVLIGMQVIRLMQSIQCQTSPDFAYLRWGDSTKSSDLMFSHPNKFMNSLTATVLGSTDAESCLAAKMIPRPDDGLSRDLQGSLSRLWPLFGTVCLSHFVESVSCAVQGRGPAYETAMTLFEQSLAFAEADAAVSNQLGWGSLGKAPGITTSAATGSITLTRSMILKRVNTAPEVLFVALISAMTHLTSHVLGVFDLQARYRLVNTGFWAFCFMASLVWAAVGFDFDDPASQGLLRFPTVCIIGLIPHILVLVGIVVCMVIYGLALMLSVLSAPSPTADEPRPGTFRERLRAAHENMQANISLSEIRVTREMDIYTALLRTGFAAVTMASEAVYLNEDHGVNLKTHTWLEEARFREAEELQKHWVGLGLANSRYDQIGAIGLVPVEGGLRPGLSGYSRERAAQKVGKKGGERTLRAGVGAAERSARWLIAFELFLSVNKLFARIGANILLWFLGIARIRARPGWLLRLARRRKETRSERVKAKSTAKIALDEVNEHPLARPEGLDIEAEFRLREPEQSAEILDSELYNYWLNGGWWGSSDESGEFRPDSDEDDWDTTSVVTQSTTADSDWESEDEGQRTPTQRSVAYDRGETPQMDSPFSMGDLARLLQPGSAEERADAKKLAAHFQSDRIMTRSQFRRMEQIQRTRILTHHNSTPGSGTKAGPSRNTKLTPEDEERLLEQLLLTRRQRPSGAASPGTWKDGASGMGSDGPQCVVCHTSPRSIIVWPCRCLSLCDDCRVSLAMNNFDKCVCCRREVISFSRIFVP